MYSLYAASFGLGGLFGGSRIEFSQMPIGVRPKLQSKTLRFLLDFERDPSTIGGNAILKSVKNRSQPGIWVLSVHFGRLILCLYCPY